MEQIWVKPAEGLKVYNIQTNQDHCHEGEWVASTPYIRRRIATGELVAFNHIPVGLQVPAGQYVEFDSSQAGASTQGRRLLVIGQVAAEGEAAAGEVMRVDSTEAVAGLFGAGSQVGAMARAAKAAHPTGEVWALPLADATGAAKATATITVSADNAKAGTIALYVAGQRVAVGVAEGADASAIAAAVKTACDNAAPALPVVAECRCWRSHPHGALGRHHRQQH